MSGVIPIGQIIGLEDALGSKAADLAYYAGSEGGHIAFSSTTAVDSVTQTGEQNVGAFVNPAGSGRDVYIWLAEFGCSANVLFRRYRGASITPISAPSFIQNMGGGSVVPVAALYAGATYIRTGGLVSKTLYLGAFNQYVTEPRLAVRIMPGQSIAWTATGSGGLGGTMGASIYLEWIEVPIA